MADVTMVYRNGLIRVQWSPDGMGHCWKDGCTNSQLEHAMACIVDGYDQGEGYCNGQLIRWFREE